MERNDELIELGVASAETHGPGVLFAEDILAQDKPRLSDD